MKTVYQIIFDIFTIGKNPDVNFNLIYICLLQNICNYGFGASSFMIVAMGWVLQKLLYSERNGEKGSNNPVQMIVCNCSTTLKITRWLDGRWHSSSRLDVFMAWHHDFLMYFMEEVGQFSENCWYLWYKWQWWLPIGCKSQHNI